MKLKYLTLICAALFISYSAFGQQERGRSSVTVHGQVRLAQGGAPAQNVLVRIERSIGGIEGEMVTDRTGKYQFSGLVPDIYIITIHSAGFIDQRREVDLQSVTNDYVLFQLLPEANVNSESASTDPSVIDANVPAEAQRELQKGVTALAKNDFRGAVPHLQKAVELYPEFVIGWLKLGTAYMDLAEWDKAEGALQKAANLDPNTNNALLALGELYLIQKKENLSEDALKRALAIDNKAWQGHLTLARLYWQRAVSTHEESAMRTALESSYKEVNAALVLKPNSAESHLLKGNLLLQAKRRQEAVSEFNEYLRLEPNGALAAETRAVVARINSK